MNRSVAMRLPVDAPRLSRTLSRYLFGLVARPFCVTLGILLPALLLERLLRLFNLVATENVRAGSLMRILLDLVPHYLGLALPAAMFVGIYAVIARLSAEQELAAMQNAGFSLTTISTPFIGIGVVFAVLGFGLYDGLQPFARYAYRADFAAATSGNWNGVVPAGEIVHVAHDTILTADTAAPASGRLGGILIDQTLPDGGEKITTARTGRLVVLPDGAHVAVWLDNARQVERMADGQLSALDSHEIETRRSFAAKLSAFRPRGDDEREMTSLELLRQRRSPHPVVTRQRLDGEIHARLVRALSLAFLPLLAVPFGVTAQRSGRQSGLVAGVVVLVVYYHLMELAQSVGTAGFLDPRPLLWGLFAAFAAGCVFTFRQANRRMGEGPLDRILDAIGTAISGARRLGRAAIAATGRP